jgi:hypothetical protein
LEEPRVTIQVAGSPQSPVVLPDFSGKLYPAQISMVGVDGLIHQTKKKKRQFYLNLKFLYKLQSKQLERI